MFGIRQIGWQLGTVSAVTAVAIFAPGSGGGSTIWLSFPAAVATFVMIAVCTWKIRERREYVGRGAARPVQAYADIWRNPHARVLYTVHLIDTLGVASIAVLARYVTEYVFGGQKMFGSLFGFYFVSAVALIPLWAVLARRFGTKPMWMFAMAMSGIGFGGFLFLREGDLLGMSILATILGIGTGCSQVMSPSIQADVIEYDEYLTGERKEGAYFAVATFLMKSAFGLMVVFAGFALDWVGYVPNVEQTEDTKQALRLLFGGFPLAAYTLSFVIFWRYFHFTPSEHQRIRRELDKRHEIAD